MALAGALCALVHAAVGFTNRSLCARVSSLLGSLYTSAQMTYDLRRLRLKGLVRRLEHTNTYVLTPEGVRVALFYTNLHDRPGEEPGEHRCLLTMMGVRLEAPLPPALAREGVRVALLHTHLHGRLRGRLRAAD